MFTNMFLANRPNLLKTPLFKTLNNTYLNFAESGGLRLKRLLESVYLDGIDGFENVRVEGGAIAGVFLDKVSPGNVKRYAFQITDTDITYKLINPSVLQSIAFAETLDFARTKLQGNTKQAKKCTKGTRCKFSCISGDKECQYTLTKTEQGEVQWLKSNLTNTQTHTKVESRADILKRNPKATDAEIVGAIASQAQKRWESGGTLSRNAYLALHGKFAGELEKLADDYKTDRTDEARSLLQKGFEQWQKLDSEFKGIYDVGLDDGKVAAGM